MTQWPEKQWLEALLLDEWREAYEQMNADQKRLVRLGYLYGRATVLQEQKDQRHGT